MNGRNYDLYNKVLELEIANLQNPKETDYKTEWAELRKEYETNLKTLYGNRDEIQNILNRLEAFTRVSSKSIIVSADLKELFHALKGAVF